KDARKYAGKGNIKVPVPAGTGLLHHPARNPWLACIGHQKGGTGQARKAIVGQPVKKAMYINITKSETGDNKGTSGALVHYLEKENRMQPENGMENKPERWFNGTANDIKPHEVRMSIDRNVAKLGREDNKFFLINVSPSGKELVHLVSKYGDDGAREKLKEFATRVMDEYARNFKRSGIESHRDLLWFGKLENHRYYSHNDKEVKSGQKR